LISFIGGVLRTIIGKGLGCTIQAPNPTSGGVTQTAVTWNSLVNCIVTGTTVNKNAGGSAFNAAARSTAQTYTGDVTFEFEIVGNGNGFICGLTSDMTGSSYTDVEYGVNNSNTGSPFQINIYEAGVLQANKGTYVVGDKIQVVRTGNTIKYYKNTSTLMYTSLVSASGKTLTAMCAAYNQGDQIKNAYFY